MGRTGCLGERVRTEGSRPAFASSSALGGRLPGGSTAAAFASMLGGMSAEEEASYACPSCGEEIEVPVDPSAGPRQEYVEDCPVCCCPVVLQVTIERDGSVSMFARAE